MATKDYRQISYGDERRWQCNHCSRLFASEETAANHTVSEHRGPQMVPTEPAGPQRPATSAPKADWVTYAAALGVPTEDQTKEQLIEATSAKD